jgi:hypothetical protein
MTFRYRHVDFGTNFESRPGGRTLADVRGNPRALHENEIALDVGNICWGCDEERLAVIDHHLQRKNQSLSASAAVLHKAELITEKVASRNTGLIWLVTHVQPDFDAFCSMYLTRSIAARLDLEGIDWIQPDLSSVPAEARWAALLACYASHVDNSRRIACPKHRALHSVLYAALQRGRDYLNPASGATELFDDARHAIEGKGLNPLFDSVLEGSTEFQPELAMLHNELDAYNRDLRRARKSVVHLQKIAKPFHDFFESVRDTPLLDDKLAPAEPHLAVSAQARSQADGIYLKDPECLLFKEWGRMDLEDSSMGAGFTFTAVAYSGGRPDGEINNTDYFLAIDPEKPTDGVSTRCGRDSSPRKYRRCTD